MTMADLQKVERGCRVEGERSRRVGTQKIYTCTKSFFPAHGLSLWWDQSNTQSGEVGRGVRGGIEGGWIVIDGWILGARNTVKGPKGRSSK